MGVFGTSWSICRADTGIGGTSRTQKCLSAHPRFDLQYGDVERRHDDERRSFVRVFGGEPGARTLRTPLDCVDTFGRCL